MSRYQSRGYPLFFTRNVDDAEGKHQRVQVPAVVINRHARRGDHWWPPNHPRHYIGRGTIFGNPFYRAQHGGRAGAIQAYREYAPTHQELMRRLPELRGCVLVCSCKPQPCHGDVIVDLLTTYTDEQLGWWTCDPA